MSGIDKVDPKASGTYRAALAAVILLSVLLVLALAAVAAGFVRQYRLHMAASPAGTVAGAAAHITLTPGAHILSAGVDSGKLVLHVQTPAGGEVDIFDLASGRLTAQIGEDQAREEAKP
ncbi:MAG TPA: hypothetical protein VG501_02350 [Rhizomicrobium sp.]|nr:hypothetical protein [Rhizomicrobium sp.]